VASAIKPQDFDNWVAELRKFQHVEINKLEKSLSGFLDDSDGEPMGEGEDDFQTSEARLEKVKKDLDQLQTLARPFLPETLKSATSHASSLDIAAGAGKLSVRQKIKTLSRKPSMEGPELAQIVGMIAELVEDLSFVTEALKAEESKRHNFRGVTASSPIPFLQTIGAHKDSGSGASLMAKKRGLHQRKPSGSSFISIVSNISKDSEVFYDANTEIVIASDGETSEEG